MPYYTVIIPAIFYYNQHAVSGCSRGNRVYSLSGQNMVKIVMICPGNVRLIDSAGAWSSSSVATGK